jgi:putative DNA methylase
MSHHKKLIEVALPLEVINIESAREKSIRHGHPSTLHLWWARRPLAACRAVLFASLVDDPSARPKEFPTEAAQEEERRRLLGIIEQLVKWENINDPVLLAEAQKEIQKSTNGNPPPILDPFCGGGSIPLEVQRLGLEAHASDINPVAVMITKALIEIPPKFKGLPPINPEARKKQGISEWIGAQGLAEDVRYYGKWVRDEAEKRIGHLYPKAQLLDGGEATVIAWLWARTVKCPNPACGCQMPLVRSFALSTKKGKETWVEPVIDRTQKTPKVEFVVQSGNGAPDGTVNRKGATCIACETPVPLEYVRSEGRAKRMGAQLMAIVAEGNRGRIYLASNAEHEQIAAKAEPVWKPEIHLPPDNTRDFRPQLYGMPTYGDLFTSRQLVVLTTLSDLVRDEVKSKIQQDALAAGVDDDSVFLCNGGTGATAYAEAVLTYLALSLDKLADYGSAICSWHSGRDTIRNTFARQAIPMVWDYAEVNPFSQSTGNFQGAVEWTVDALKYLPSIGAKSGLVEQRDATDHVPKDKRPLVFTTDPPYYDNIGYADLSDFFYVWLRRSLGEVYPSIFKTLTTPKSQELIYAPHRFGGDKEKAKQFFENGLKQAFQRTYEASDPDYPFTVFYAFKQTETDEEDSKNGNGLSQIASTGWETMLESLIQAGFSVTGTWPMRTELSNRMVARDSNALASSIALVCRPILKNAPSITRRQFINELKRELPVAIKNMQQGNLAPVDLQQASIGPGIAVFSRYKQVLESDGNPMRVRTALQLINQILDEYLSDQEGEFDADSRWALTWFEQYQFNEGVYGDAETLSKAKNVSIKGLEEAGILIAKSGKVRLIRRSELPDDWDPTTDSRIPDWEITQHLIRSLEQKGFQGAATLVAPLNGRSEIARDLAYRLYSICDRNGWTQEAIAYDNLVRSWPEIARLAHKTQQSTAVQTELRIEDHDN